MSFDEFRQLTFTRQSRVYYGKQVKDIFIFMILIFMILIPICVQTFHQPFIPVACPGLMLHCSLLPCLSHCDVKLDLHCSLALQI